MDYLQRLKAETAAREQFEEENMRLKVLFIKINEYHSAYDGDFINALEQFMKSYTPPKTNSISQH